jgi:hypothetical protein
MMLFFLWSGLVFYGICAPSPMGAEMTEIGFVQRCRSGLEPRADVEAFTDSAANHKEFRVTFLHRGFLAVFGENVVSGMGSGEQPLCHFLKKSDGILCF